MRPHPIHLLTVFFPVPMAGSSGFKGDHMAYKAKNIYYEILALYKEKKKKSRHFLFLRKLHTFFKFPQFSTDALFPLQDAARH